MAEGTRSIGRHLAVWGGILVSTVILGYLAINLDWATLGREFQRVKLLYVPALLLILLVTFWIRALRWRHLLPTEAKLSRLRLFEATVVGFTASFILPLRAGEFVRPWVLSRWQPVGFSTAFASIVTERVFDALSLISLLGLLLGQHDKMPAFVATGANILAVVALGILAIMVYTYCCADQTSRFAKRIVSSILGRRFPKLTTKLLGMLDGFLDGLRAISSFKELAFVIFWSFTLWLGHVLLYQCGLWAFGIHPSWWIGVALCVMIALAVAAPGAPGFIGTFQLGCIVALGLYGLSEEFAVAYSVVQHALQVVATVLLGLAILHKRGLHLADLKQHSHK